MSLRLVLQNETAYHDADLRRLLLRGLRANRVDGVVRVRVVRAPARSRGCAQVACVSRGRCEMVLALGPPSYQGREAFMRRLSRLIDHEAAHLRGAEHEDMNERDLYSEGPTSSWARGMKIRRRAPGYKKKPPPLLTSVTWHERGPGRSLPSAARDGLGLLSAARDHSRSRADHRIPGPSDIRLYYVYVVEMLAVESRTSSDRRPRVYVGSSALPPEARLRKHRGGGLAASGRVRRDGRRLRADLAPKTPFRSRWEARRAEGRVARDLERRGFEVVGACRPRRDRGCAAL